MGGNCVSISISRFICSFIRCAKQRACIINSFLLFFFTMDMVDTDAGGIEQASTPFTIKIYECQIFGELLKTWTHKKWNTHSNFSFSVPESTMRQHTLYGCIRTWMCSILCVAHTMVVSTLISALFYDMYSLLINKRRAFCYSNLWYYFW